MRETFTILVLVFFSVCGGVVVNISVEAHRDHRLQIPLELITGNS